MSASFAAPTIPPRLRRPLAAAWISLGLHAAVIALVQVAAPAATNMGGPVIEARLVPAHAATPVATPSAPAAESPDHPAKRKAPLAPSDKAEALPLAEPLAPPPTHAAPSATASQAVSPVPGVSQPAPAAAPAPAPGVTITSAVDLTYYGARDLDVQPRALRKVVPDYPDDADRQRLSGSVRLQLKLEEDGRISDIKVVSATPPGVFDASALQAFHSARFAPAQKNGQPVRALVLIEVVYDWEGRR